MIVNVKTQELSPGITAMTFTGRLIRGNKWNDIEFVIRERIQQGLRNLVLDFSGLKYIDSAGIGFLAVCIGLIEKAGGRVAIAGVTDQNLEIAPYDELINKEAEIIGVSDHLAQEIPQLFDLVLAGKLNAGAMINQTIPLDEKAINETMDSLEKFSDAVRVVITP